MKMNAMFNEEDVSDFSLFKLIEFVESNFHAYFNEVIRDIDIKLLSATKIDNCEAFSVNNVYDLFSQFREMLSQHIGEEKHIVFPIIKKQITDTSTKTDLEEKEIRYIFKNIEKEHHRMGKYLKTISEGTNNFKIDLSFSPVLKDCFLKLEQVQHNYVVYQFIEANYLYPKINQIKSKSLI